MFSVLLKREEPNGVINEKISRGIENEKEQKEEGEKTWKRKCRGKKEKGRRKQRLSLRKRKGGEKMRKK
jgi:hypothetical protein